ncbi:MAG: formylglycine-generating enzyme family protein [Candidatus Adiutrix sp.]|jgi:formylglycine-generating enzyme required for sulfatase activity|nr:formylglycine-generating enzyme family protein [Candidatus Adiutrix sp.]
MDREIINILLRIREAQGVEVFSDLKKCRSFLADYTAGTYKAESRAMLLGLEEKFYDRLRGAGALTATEVRGLERRLISAYFLNEPAASFIVRGWCEVFGLRCPEPGFGQAEASLSKSRANSIGMEFVLIPAGEFMMGSPDGDEDADCDENQHRVTISRPFCLGKYEVTQAQWEAVMGNNPSEFEGRNNPVENVSWDDVQEFINKLNQKEGGNKYRLPTEAEWEYAARAGTTSTYSFGDDAEALGRYAWYGENSGGTTHPVGQKEPNAWGLYDMHGNVWEWVQDWYDDYSGSPATDPLGASSGSSRVFRGGDNAWSCRSAFRSGDTPDARYDYLGFRLAFSPGQ